MAKKSNGLTATPPTPVTSLVASPSPYENSITITWSGAKPGTSNPITGYDIRYAFSADGVNWPNNDSIQVGLVNSYVFNTASTPRGYYFRHFLYTIGQYSNSSYATGNVVRKNFIPNTPGKPNVSATLAEPTQPFQLTFTNPGDPDGNAAGWESAIQYENGAWYNNAQIMGWNSTPNATFISFNLSGWARGGKWKFCVHGYDALGARGGWSPPSDLVTIASLPPTPVISAPVQGATSYNNKPRILISVGDDADGMSQKVFVNIPSVGWVNTVDNPQYFSVSGWIPSGKTAICQLPATSGNVSISVYQQKNTTGSVSSTVTKSFTVQSPVWTDATLVANQTPVKAVHMNELHSYINQVCGYYNLAPYDWDTITAGATKLEDWSAHVLEIRNAINQMIEYINGFDSSATKFDIPVPAWIPIPQNSPKVDVITQIRSIVEIL